jgi:hypothetical protein
MAASKDPGTMAANVAAFETEHPGLRARWVASGDKTLLRLAREVAARGWVTDLDLISAAKTLARLDRAAAVTAGSKYLGTRGLPLEVTVTIDRVLRFGTAGGDATTYVHLMTAGTDAVCYRGGVVLGAPGDTVTVCATVRAHEVRDGTRTTLIGRPRVLGRSLAPP